MASVVFDVTLAGNNPWDLLYLAGGDPYHMRYDSLTKTLTDNTITQAALDQALIDLTAGVVSPVQQIIATESALTLITISDLAMAIAGDSVALTKIITSVGAVPNVIPPIPSSISTKNALSETTNPTITDDTSNGFSKSSIWINTISNRVYICLDSSIGTAIWHRIDVTSVTLDGNSSHIIRNNSTVNIPPTTNEATNPINGDTAILHLLNNSVEYWSNDGNSWSLDFTQVPTVLDGNRINLTRNNSLIGISPTTSEVPSPVNGDTSVVFLQDGTVEYWNYDGTIWILANSMLPVVLDGNAHYITRGNLNTSVAPNTSEIATPINGDTAIVFLLNDITEYWSFTSNLWILKHTFQSKLSTSSPLQATGSTGAIGSSDLFAREDHKHPAQGISSDIDNSLSIGSDGLPFNPISIPDGSNYHVVRTNSNRGISPTLIEITKPSNHDTATIFLSDRTIEYWGYSVNSWILDNTVVFNQSNSIPLVSVDSIGSVGTSHLFARADHKHPTPGVSSDLDNVLSIGSDGLAFFPKVILDGSTTHINRINELPSIPPSNSEVTNPINGDTAIVFLLNNVIEFWGFSSNSWSLSQTHKLYLADSISPQSDDSIGGVGIVRKVAREDHKHPAQAISHDPNNALTIGTDGLHFLQNMTPDGKLSLIQRLNSSHISPSLIEVSNPVPNDTVIVFSSDDTQDYWQYDGTSWILIYSEYNHQSVITPLSSTGQTGKIGTSDLFAREDHIHPASKPSSDSDNLLKLGSDGLITHTHRFDNLSGVKNPTANDDSLIGYSVGSVWFNIKNANAFVCVFDAPHFAIWMLLTPASVPEFKFRTKQPTIEGTDLKSTKESRLIEIRNLFNSSAETGIDIEGVRISWTLETINNLEFSLRVLDSVDTSTVFVRDSNGILVSFDKHKSEKILDELRDKYHRNMANLYDVEQKIHSETVMQNIVDLLFVIV